MKNIVLGLLMAMLWLPTTAGDKGQAIATFDKTVHDFGYIKESKGVVSCTFEFENTGTEPLLVIEALASCGCTRPEYPVKPIKPGKKGKIKVQYNPTGRPGGFRKNIKVKTNGKKRVITLYIEGSVIPREEED